MNIKKIHAKDMHQAMTTITREFGLDAVILSNEKVKKKGLRYIFSKPFYEVVVAYDPSKTPTAIKRAQTAIPPPEKVPPGTAIAEVMHKNGAPVVRGGVPGMAKPATETRLDRLDEQIAALNENLAVFADRFRYIKRDVTFDYSPEVEELVMKLIASHMREELAHSFGKEAEEILKRKPGGKATEVMEQILTDCIGEPYRLAQKKFRRKIVIFVGATGVGKTTSLVKLAANFAIKERKKVGIINTDTYRIAAHEQLRTYADILDIPLGIVYNPEELGPALAEQEDRDIVFIDTAGKRPGDPQHRESIEKMVSITGADEVFLTMSAPTSFASLKDIMDSYSFLGDYKILVTKIDETGMYGNIVNMCWYSGKPLTYISTGQNVPDDIEPASTVKIVDMVLGKRV